MPVYLRITDISDDGRFIAETKLSVNHLAYKEFYLEVNDIVFARTGASTGKTYLYTPFDGLLVYAGFLIKFSINPEILNPVFLKYFTFTNSYWNWVKIMSSRSGQPGINAQEYQLIKIPLPPLPEQKKSAEILSTWDEAIEKLNSYIEAKKKLKKALMRRLLTGKQRFKEFIVREGYKKTELGWIPEDWEVRRLGESCELLKDGTHSSHIDVEPSQGLPLLSAKDINNGKIFFSQESRHISEVDFKQIHKSYFLSDGDILLTIVASIGRVAVVENYERNYTIQRSIAVIRLRKQFYNYFYFYFFQCLYFQKELIQRSNASAQAGVYLGELSKIKIPLPPLPEQKKIAEILSKADEEIDLLNQELEKLKTQKKGLMQKLLTGAWRVKL